MKYVNNQEKHHQKQTFQEEYIHLLNRFNVSYNEQYLFNFSMDS